MARNEYSAILVIGRLLRTKTSVRMWGDDDDDDDEGHTEGRKSLGVGIKATEGVRARNHQPLWVDESNFCAYAESKQTRMGVWRSGHS